jgi:Na+/H+ antiporter NhaA
LIDLELECEIYIGELSSLKSALLPIIAASSRCVKPNRIRMFRKSDMVNAGIKISCQNFFDYGVVIGFFGIKISITGIFDYRIFRGGVETKTMDLNDVDFYQRSFCNETICYL